MYQKILFADDLSRRAQKALREAVELARLVSAELVILNVRQDFLNKEEMIMLRVDLSDVVDDITRKAVEIRRRIELDVDAYGGTDLKYRILLREGKPGEVICQVAEELKVDLVVVGSHGTSPLKDALFGSTAHHVINHAGRSVLAVWTKT